jgi:hypothetical protein
MTSLNFEEKILEQLETINKNLVRVSDALKSISEEIQSK